MVNRLEVLLQSHCARRVEDVASLWEECIAALDAAYTCTRSVVILLEMKGTDRRYGVRGVDDE